MDFGARILERMTVVGIPSQAELARRVGITQPSINHLIRAGAQGSKYLHALARELKTTPEYLSGGTDDPDADYVPLPSLDSVAEQLDLVPVQEIDLKFGMGATELEVPVTTVVRHFSRDWLRQYTRASPESLYFAQGIGDSMEPTIKDSDLLLIDTSERHLRISDKIWAVAHYGAGKVKRLRPTKDGIKILSDNKDVAPPEEAKDGELFILGRVVGIVRKM